MPVTNGETDNASCMVKLNSYMDGKKLSGMYTLLLTEPDKGNPEKAPLYHSALMNPGDAAINETEISLAITPYRIMNPVRLSLVGTQKTINARK